MDASFSSALPLIILIVGSMGVLASVLFLDRASSAGVAPPPPPPGEQSGVPRVSYLEAPKLPDHLSYWGIQAEAVLRFTVSKTGKASQIRMVRTTHMEIVSSCIEAVRGASFLPARNREGEAIETSMVLPICPLPPKPREAQRREPARSCLARVG
jgi:hypothetical protein